VPALVAPPPDAHAPRCQRHLTVLPPCAFGQSAASLGSRFSLDGKAGAWPNVHAVLNTIKARALSKRGVRLVELPLEGTHPLVRIDFATAQPYEEHDPRQPAVYEAGRAAGEPDYDYHYALEQGSGGGSSGGPAYAQATPLGTADAYEEMGTTAAGGSGGAVGRRRGGGGPQRRGSIQSLSGFDASEVET